MSRKAISTIAAFAYAIGATLTYGHAYNNIEPTSWSWSLKQMEPRTTSDKFFISAAAALYWPAYASILLFEKPSKDAP